MKSLREERKNKKRGVGVNSIEEAMREDMGDEKYERAKENMKLMRIFKSRWEVVLKKKLSRVKQRIAEDCGWDDEHGDIITLKEVNKILEEDLG